MKAPIKCPNCGSIGLREVTTNAAVWHDYKWSYIRNHYQLTNEDAEGGYVKLECADCGYEFDNDTHTKFRDNT